ncbi:mannan endo-1,6-alpha-mannosidase DCW1-like protein [Nemania sp. FL0916]|nr:mannan endo-1,6-alpha-mannosidase DCW1-like protein [Nemania sp. FL0916]
MTLSLVQLATPRGTFVPPQNLDINNPESIKSVASTVAYGTMSFYTGNVTNTPDTIAIFPKPHYWWQAGACWGAMLDYSHYTGDTSYDDVVRQALLSQVGPKFDFMDSRYAGSEGNDDQAFWAFAILEAAERNFPQPNDAIPSWLQIAENIWNTMVVRWDDTTCGGGLHWQIYPDNPNGLDYKNAVSNGGFFQISARLARATDNETYLHWAEKVWDWSQSVGFVDGDFAVFDGASSAKECRNVNFLRFSYSQGIYMYGTAMLFNYTNGNETWANRTHGLLEAARAFFSPYPNATNVMFEPACEVTGTCNTDMKSFKGYLSRFMAATAQIVPSTLKDVKELLAISAVAAGKACSGGDNGTVCGQKWYVGSYDGSPGLGQQMTALETIQALLAFDARPPLRFGEIKDVKGVDGTHPASTTPTSSSSSTSPSASPTAQQPDSFAHTVTSGYNLVLAVVLSLFI